eukprot:5606821-Pyramimonas_sp.AAC.1
MLYCCTCYMTCFAFFLGIILGCGTFVHQSVGDLEAESFALAVRPPPPKAKDGDHAGWNGRRLGRRNHLMRQPTIPEEQDQDGDIYMPPVDGHGSGQASSSSAASASAISLQPPPPPPVPAEPQPASSPPTPPPGIG